MFRAKLRLLTLADMFLILFLLSAAVLSYIYINKTKSRLSAYVYYHNNLLGTYELSKPQVIEINDKCSAEIKNNKIRMLNSDCRDKLCVKQGWSDMIPIICLPNQIVIEVKSNTGKQNLHILH